MESESPLDTMMSLLGKRSLTIALAESCTAGLASSMIGGIPGASRFLLGSIVTYSNESKVSLANVSQKTLDEYGAVSAETAMELADNVRSLFKSDVGCSITGIAGPSGGSPDKPVGLVFIAVSTGECVFRKLMLNGSRNDIRAAATNELFETVVDVVNFHEKV